MMAATLLNLRFEQGSRFFLDVDVPEDENGNPIDLTNYTGHLQVRFPREGVLLEDIGDNVEITANSIAVDIPGDITELFDWNMGYYDLYVTDGTTTLRLLEGFASVSPQVTLITGT